MTSTELQTLSFHGDQLVTFKVDDVPYVAMRPIVENLGLSWSGQRTKIQSQKGKFSCADISTTGSDGKTYRMLSIPTKKLSLWLASINPVKIKDAEKRRKVELYQEESAEALYNYWHHGLAVRGDTDGVITDIDPRVMNALGGMVKGIIGKALGEVVPALVQQQISDKEIGVVRGVTAYDVVGMIGIYDRKGLPRGLGNFISGRLRRYHAKKGIAVKLRDYGAMASVNVFDKAAVKEWLAGGGKREIENYIDEKRGQRNLRLVAAKT